MFQIDVAANGQSSGSRVSGSGADADDVGVAHGLWQRYRQRHAASASLSCAATNATAAIVMKKSGR
jgi:hypothetical protein